MAIPMVGDGNKNIVVNMVRAKNPPLEKVVIEMTPEQATYLKVFLGMSPGNCLPLYDLYSAMPKLPTPIVRKSIFDGVGPRIVKKIDENHFYS